MTVGTPSARALMLGTRSAGRYMLVVAVFAILTIFELGRGRQQYSRAGADEIVKGRYKKVF